MKAVKLSLIVFFLTLIVAPAAQYLHPFVKVMAIDEKRERATWPDEGCWQGLRAGTGYCSKVEQFFSDHFPLRDAMVRGLSQFEYSVLGRSREVIVGKDGWLADKVVVEQLHQLDKVTAEQMQAGVVELKRLQYWLESRGVAFYLVIIPMKTSIYAEEFPERYTQRPPMTGLQRFQEALKNNDIPFLDVLSLFKKHKNGDNLFYQTDMHWNSVGASYVAKAIINHFSTKLLGKDIWNEPLVKSHQKFSGQELSTMPLLFSPYELTPTWLSPKTDYVKHVDPIGDCQAEFYTGTDQSRAQLPPSIMFGNSFMLIYPDVGYHNYFVQSTRVLDYQYFSKVLDYVQPQNKIFILHIYETQLLFHLLPVETSGYWDKRIKQLPLPPGYVYR